MNRRLVLEKELRRIRDILIRKYHPRKIIVFGSITSGKIHDYSDLDVVVIKQTKKRIYDRIGEVVKLCDPEIAVDFIVYTPDEFQQMQEEESFIREEMVKNGKVIYEAA